MTDQDVAKEREDDDEGVSHDEQGFHCGVLGLGSVALPAHEVLPVGEGIVVPGEEVRGVGPHQGRLRALLFRGSRHCEEEEQHAPRVHLCRSLRARDGTGRAGRPTRPRTCARARGEERAGLCAQGLPASQRPAGAHSPPASRPRSARSGPPAALLCLRCATRLRASECLCLSGGAASLRATVTRSGSAGFPTPGPSPLSL